MKVLEQSIGGFKVNRATAFFNEIILNSGQYAIFYLLFELSDESLVNFFTAGHVTLLLALVLQTMLLVGYGQNIFPRFFISLVAPFVYSFTNIVLKDKVPSEFFLESTHFCFWAYSIVVSTLQCISLYLTAKHSLVKWLDVLVVMINVSIFSFLYFLFEAHDTAHELYKSGKVGKETLDHAYSIFSIPENIPLFFNDTTHWYIFLAGVFLAVSIAYSRYHL
ncbi:MAG: hypothetical protein HQM14_21490, partial [SAR324 cluster bacterium]|nr:hypothetical protein [SAR324 cluster bacterium]